MLNYALNLLRLYAAHVSGVSLLFISFYAVQCLGLGVKGSPKPYNYLLLTETWWN